MTTCTLSGVTGVLHTTLGSFDMGPPIMMVMDGLGIDFTFFQGASPARGEMRAFTLSFGNRTVRNEVPRSMLIPGNDVTILQHVELDL